MHYEIDSESFAISIFDGQNPEPFWFQPDYPNGDKFDSFAEAEEWAIQAMNSQDPSFAFYPPNGKGMTPEAKPTEEEILQGKLQRTGLTVDDLKKLLGLE